MEWHHIFCLNWLQRLSPYSELTQFTRQAKVNNLDLGTSCIHTDYVLRFEVQVNDILLVNVLHALQDLLHVAGTCGLCVLKVVIHKTFK